jgi:hypothetical protein
VSWRVECRPIIIKPPKRSVHGNHIPSIGRVETPYLLAGTPIWVAHSVALQRYSRVCGVNSFSPVNYCYLRNGRLVSCHWQLRPSCIGYNAGRLKFNAIQLFTLLVAALAATSPSQLLYALYYFKSLRPSPLIQARAAPFISRQISHSIHCFSRMSAFICNQLQNHGSS